MKIVEKLWGWERWIENNELYCLKELVCTGGIWTSKGKYHYHPIKDETFYIVEGQLELDIEGTASIFSKGDVIRIKPNTKHRFRSRGAHCKFMEVSTTHCDTDSIRCKLEDEI